MNILIPMAGKSQHFPEAEYPFPKPLIEIDKKTMIERVIDNLSSAADKVNFIFVISGEDCQKFHIDSTLNILTSSKCQIVRLDKEARGSACSALMAIDYIANDQPLLIANSDQIFDQPLSALINEFNQVDAGVITFNSVHPRWSYVRLDENRSVVEAAEKRPLSRHAIAGIYYFQKGSYFVDAAMQMIQKDENVNGNYFVAPALNQMILMGNSIGMREVDSDSYHTFYTPQKIQEYERSLFGHSK